MDRPNKPYFSPPLPRVFAHRGLALRAPENTLAAFEAATAAGCTYIETDVHASRDGVSVISHDDDLRRVAQLPGRVADLDLSELQRVDLGDGHTFPSLEEALLAFPQTCFNIDIKSMDAAAPTIAAIRAAGAVDRVLVTSFSEVRRRRVVRGLPGVATSASSVIFVGALLAAKLRWQWLVNRVLSSVDAVQIPERALGMTVSDPATVARFLAAGVEVHFWTINAEPDMRRLLMTGASGLVTDRADLAQRVVRESDGSI